VLPSDPLKWECRKGKEREGKERGGCVMAVRDIDAPDPGPHAPCSTAGESLTRNLSINESHAVTTRLLSHTI